MTFKHKNHSWSLVVTRGHSWSLVVTRGHSWSFVVTRGHSWSFVVTRGHSWSLVVIRGHSWSLVCTFRQDPCRDMKLEKKFVPQKFYSPPPGISNGPPLIIMNMCVKVKFKVKFMK